MSPRTVPTRRMDQSVASRGRRWWRLPRARGSGAPGLDADVNGTLPAGGDVEGGEGVGVEGERDVGHAGKAGLSPLDDVEAVLPRLEPEAFGEAEAVPVLLDGELREGQLEGGQRDAHGGEALRGSLETEKVSTLGGDTGGVAAAKGMGQCDGHVLCYYRACFFFASCRGTKIFSRPT